MSAIVEAGSVNINTLSVTIKALQVNNKQMTLALFKQLPVGNAYRRDGGLMQGVEFWGRVRYEIKDSADHWVLAVSDGQLYRCSIYWAGIQHDWVDEELKGAEARLAWWRATKAKVDAGPVTQYELYSKDYGNWKLEQLPQLEAAVAERKRARDTAYRAVDTRRVLNKLPQLFIAV